MTELALCGVGEALARARQTQGLELADIAQQLKLAPRHLEAIEQERFEALPGGTFARGMVRNYARLLKLDPEPLLERISGRFDTPDADQLAKRFRQPVPFSDSGRRSTLVYFALSICVLGFVGLIAYEWHRESREPVLAAAKPASAPAQTTSATPAPPAMVKDVSEPVVKPVPAAADPAKSVGAGGRIVLRCEQESWIEVREAAGRLLISSLNPAGSERVVEGRPPFSLVIGNAQHVRVRYNDEPVDLHPHIKVEVARLTLR